MQKKSIITVISIMILMLIPTFIIINFTTKEKYPVIGFYRTSPELNTHLLKILEGNESGFGKSLKTILYKSEKELLEQFISSPSDLILTENFTLNDSWEEMLTSVDSELMNRYPRSTKEFSIYNNIPYLLPIQLDHIEFAYNKKRLNNSTTGNNIIFSFTDLEIQLLSLVSDKHYPLMISGDNNRDLLDAISVLTLSISGVEGYKKLQSLFVSDKPFSEIVLEKLRGDISFGDVLAKLTEWKNVGILHPEWLRFTREDALLFLENDLSSAYIMRLSTHRTLPENLLQKINETPFPFLAKEDRATALVMPGYSLAVYRKSLFRKKALTVFSEILSKNNQKLLSEYSGLAPTTSTAEALDKQSSDVRLWGAASQHLLVPLSDLNMELNTDLREYLIH